MTLLHFDTFSLYRSPADLQARYSFLAGAGNALLDGVSDRGIQCLRLAGTSIFTAPASSGNPGITFGIRLKIGLHLPTGARILSVIQAGLPTYAVRYRQKTATTFFLEFCLLEAGQVTVVHGKSADYNLNQWITLECGINLHATTGSVTWRSGGYTETRITNVKTAPAAGWSALEIANEIISSVYIAGLYIQDQVDDFLGNFVSLAFEAAEPETKFLPQGWDREGGHVYTVNYKKTLHVMSGQSNMNGHSSAPLPVTPGVYNPNPTVLIWDRVSGAPLLRPLSCPANSNYHYFLDGGGNHVVGNFVGPEMAFATHLQEHFQKATYHDLPFGHVIVKGSQDASSIYPNASDYCWNDLVPGNLWNNLGGIAHPNRGWLKKDMEDAIAACGGINSIEEICFYWLQGEFEAIFDFAAEIYFDLLTDFFKKVRSDFAGYKIRFFVLRIHNKLTRGTGPFTLDGLWYTDHIRSIQEQYCQLHDDTTMIDIDSAQIANDKVHFTKAGYDKIGRLCFDAWLSGTASAAQLANTDTLSYITTQQTNAVSRYRIRASQNCQGSAVLADRTVMQTRAYAVDDLKLQIDSRPEFTITPDPNTFGTILTSLGRALIPGQTLSQYLKVKKV